jgi:DNA-binding beta-propeller fold protein YncE
LRGSVASAQFNCPHGVAVDGEDNVIITDRNNDRVRKIAPDGTVTTLAAQFKYPEGVAVDGEGNIIVTDRYNNRLRKITPDGTVRTRALLRAGHREELPSIPSVASLFPLVRTPRL